MNIRRHELGTFIQSGPFQILLGNRHASIASLSAQFRDIQFKRIKQVHGDQFIHTSRQALDFSREADAHYTSETALGLCISTADCIPVFLAHEKSKWIAGIHAGWRGVENRIVPKTIRKLGQLGCPANELQVFVGPHIQYESFEVENKVRDRLLESVKARAKNYWSPLSDEKSRVDLHGLMKTQLEESKIDLNKTFFEIKDSVQNQDYHSHRRDQENAGRQLSFISIGSTS